MLNTYEYQICQDTQDHKTENRICPDRSLKAIFYLPLNTILMMMQINSCTFLKTIFLRVPKHIFVKLTPSIASNSTKTQM